MAGWQDLDEATDYVRGALTGQRVVLRALREDDLADLERWWEDPAVVPGQRLVITPQREGAASALFRQWSANDSPGPSASP